MKVVAAIAFLGSLRSVLAHGSHGGDAPAEGETIQQYAQRHVCGNALHMHTMC